MQTQASPAASVRRRAMREDVRRSRAALDIVRPLHRELSTWQLEIARLISGAQRHSQRNEPDTSLRRRAAELERSILGASHALTRALEEAPDEVRQHGRVVDVRRAMESALRTLSQAQQLLD